MDSGLNGAAREKVRVKRMKCKDCGAYSPTAIREDCDLGITEKKVFVDGEIGCKHTKSKIDEALYEQTLIRIAYSLHNKFKKSEVDENE